MAIRMKWCRLQQQHQKLVACLSALTGRFSLKRRTQHLSRCRGSDGGARQAQGYTAEWEAHVLSVLPMWTALLPVFLDQCLARVSYIGDAVLADLLSVRLHV